MNTRYGELKANKDCQHDYRDYANQYGVRRAKAEAEYAGELEERMPCEHVGAEPYAERESPSQRT